MIEMEDEEFWQEVDFCTELVRNSKDVFSDMRVKGNTEENTVRDVSVVYWVFLTLDKYMFRWSLANRVNDVPGNLISIWGFLVRINDKKEFMTIGSTNNGVYKILKEF